MRRAVVVAIVLANLIGVQAVASAAWMHAGSGTASVRARTMPAGNTPTASVSGRNVTVSWAASTFPDGQNVAGYRVARHDAATGTPQAVGPACSGTVTSTSCTEADVPPGSWRYAVTPLQGAWVGAESGRSAPATVLPSDTEPPTVTASVVGKTQGGVPGFIRAGGTYHVYANVTDGGTPPSGVASVTADVSSITAGQAAVTLASGTFSIGGVTYSHRSASLIADGALPAGSRAYAITATDVAGNARTQTGFTVVVDNTPPVATDVQTANVAGGTVGKAETGDTLAFTFSETIEPITIVAGWTGAATPVTVRLVNGIGAARDSLQIWNAANAAQLPLGAVDLGSPDYVSADSSFTGSTMVQSGSTITITLGIAVGVTLTTSDNGTMVWTPSATATDRAANPCSTAALTEPGAADREF